MRAKCTSVEFCAQRAICSPLVLQSRREEAVHVLFGGQGLEMLLVANLHVELLASVLDLLQILLFQEAACDIYKFPVLLEELDALVENGLLQVEVVLEPVQVELEFQVRVSPHRADA